MSTSLIILWGIQRWWACHTGSLTIQSYSRMLGWSMIRSATQAKMLLKSLSYSRVGTNFIEISITTELFTQSSFYSVIFYSSLTIFFTTLLKWSGIQSCTLNSQIVFCLKLRCPRILDLKRQKIFWRGWREESFICLQVRRSSLMHLVGRSLLKKMWLSARARWVTVLI